MFTISIDAHWLIVDSLDGVPTEPSSPGRAVKLNVAQRASVLVCPDGSTVPGAPAWIRAAMDQDVFAEPSADPVVLAVLQYGTPTAAPRALPTTQEQPYPPSQLLGGSDPGTVDPYTGIVPRGRLPSPPATRTINLDLASFGTPTGCENCTQYMHFNGISMMLPQDSDTTLPSLLEGYLRVARCQPTTTTGPTQFLCPRAPWWTSL